ncbi:MAG TPA: PilN domain-containing protein [Solirubrobacteraceae bacterium]|nr:PilN domain-containing protein [Solirubrobacteraceae bacterium]
MRAVNLLPHDQRRGGGSPSRSGQAPYLLLGVLAAAVVAVGAYVFTSNQVTSNRAEVAESQQEAASLEQQATAFKPYKDFADMSRARVQTVAQLAGSRFDWERVMRQLSRAMPGDVWLTSLVGTVAPGVSLDGTGAAGSATGGLRSAVNGPAVELVGCTESQAAVSRVMARLRTINGVQRVSLASSEKSDAVSGGGSGGANSGDCRNGSSRFPQFQIVVFFDAPKVALGAAAPGAGTAPVSTGVAK